MRALLDVLLAPACAGCRASGALLCPKCLDALPSPFNAGDRFVAADAGIVVGDAFVVAIAAFAHDGPIRRALAALKYNGTSRIAPVLARPALPAFRALTGISGHAALVPVPVHEDRRRHRGYNQAELIARELAAGVGLQVADVLQRSRPTTKQHRLGRAARLANLRDAFGIREAKRVPPTAILIDDIITTAATLEACAAVLRAAGATEVYGFAIAREV